MPKTTHAVMTSREYHYTPEGELLRMVHTTHTTILSTEVYTVTESGLEMYRGRLIDEPHWAYLLSEMDGDRAGWEPRPY